MRGLLLAAALLAGASPALAAPGDEAASGVAGMGGRHAAVDPERRAVTRRLLEASNFRARQSVLLDEGVEAARATVLEDCMNRAAAGKPINCPSSARRLSPADREHLIDAIMEGAQTVYAETFIAAEMDQLTSFFQSDIGRKYGQAYPGMLARVQVIKHRLLVDALQHLPDPASSGARP